MTYVTLKFVSPQQWRASSSVWMTDSVAELWMYSFWGFSAEISAGWSICACSLICHINASLEQGPCGLCALFWKAPNKQDRKGQDRTNGSHFTLTWFLFGYKHIQLMLKWKKLRWLNLNLPLLCAKNTTFSPQYP